MRRAMLLVVGLLTSGCLTIEDAPDANLPALLTDDGPPPVPAGADVDGPRKIGRCFKDSAFIFHGIDPTIDLPVGSSFAEAHESKWLNATVAIVARSGASVSQRLNATPFVQIENGTKSLAYRIERDPSESNFIEDLQYGRWYPWNVSVVVASDEPALADLGRMLEGWILVAAGGKPGQSDDRVYAYLDRQRLVEDPFHRIPLEGGDLFLSSRGICAD